MQDAEQPPPAAGRAAPNTGVERARGCLSLFRTSFHPRSLACQDQVAHCPCLPGSTRRFDLRAAAELSTLGLEEDAAPGHDLALMSLSALSSAAGVKLEEKTSGKCCVQTMDASAATDQQGAWSSECRYSVEGQEALPEAPLADLGYDSETSSGTEGEEKGSVRGSVLWGCYYATALDIEVDPQRRRFGGPVGRGCSLPRRSQTRPFL